jgi:protein-S-isoprenylcysteine O-methyltransferase Ste14
LDAELHQSAVWLQFVLAAVTLVAVSWIVAPYGRHQRPGWGPTVPARLGWIIMESPAVFAFLAIYWAGGQSGNLVPLLLLGLWQLHYVHRTLVFPFRLRLAGKRMPLLIIVMAIGFNLLNAYVNAGWIGHLGHYPDDWLSDPRLIAGVIVFGVGMGINLWADQRLIRLREDGDGYQIPRGGLYERIACPNYLGEILEWCGWALATWSWAGLAFAVYTIANLLPRAVHHLRWYRQQFPNYPRNRRALIPGIL